MKLKAYYTDDLAINSCNNMIFEATHTEVEVNFHNSDIYICDVISILFNHFTPRNAWVPLLYWGLQTVKFRENTANGGGEERIKTNGVEDNRR